MNRGLDRAIARRDWDLAALYVLYAVTRAASRLPKGTAADLLDLLAGESEGVERVEREGGGR